MCSLRNPQYLARTSINLLSVTKKKKKKKTIISYCQAKNKIGVFLSAITAKQLDLHSSENEDSKTAKIKKY